MRSGRFSMSRKKERIFERRYFGDNSSHNAFFMVESTIFTRCVMYSWDREGGSRDVASELGIS
jgi:hypothetical protein